ncbi:BNR repeat-containing protein [Faecalicatena contorta]|uniref:BNR repeat-containing family member n=1 Tax=Faecalicatena contorta TaxID=39482 RepID=A0A315ZUN2_9FIRM|nr:BNR repeat-containing protein [Faecalicatena contorta]PWJ48354.1 putative BNR repeat neuraminidase [Faecalicatena contorta]SUQ15377.1 BNR repeat-containing family member [Faecalicatena contorta]
MKWKKGICLLAAMLVSVSNISYAEDIENSTETYEDGTTGIGMDEGQNSEQDASQNLEQNAGQDPSQSTEQSAAQNTGQSTEQNAGQSLEQDIPQSMEQDEREYVVWGQGKGITPETLDSRDDQFAPVFSDLVIVKVETSLKNKIETYWKKNTEEINFGQLISQGQIQNTKVAFYEYENAMIFTSDYGTYSIRLPMLNTFISSGGVESLGVPLGEQIIKNGHAYQKFEKGTASCRIEKCADTLVVRRRNVYYFKNTLGNGEADKVVAYGKAGDEVLVGDWDGDGLDTLCVRRGNTYYFKNSISSGEADSVIQYGKAGDEVLVGDWDGDGLDTLCVRRGNTYYFKNSISSGEADSVIQYGRAGDKVLIGDWNGDELDTLCVRRGKEYHFKNSISSGAADSIIIYGKAGDEVLVGDWDGDGMDTLCVRRQNAYYIKNSIQSGPADLTVLYGKANDVTYTGAWASQSKIEKNNAENLSFNNSQGFNYSRLTQAFAGNSVNSTAFRKSAVTTHVDAGGNQIQYCAYYDSDGTIVLARRTNAGEWSYQWTDFKGDIADAHNVVSLAVDGAGYLHMAWSRHAGALMYAKSESPGTMTMIPGQMIGTLENNVTYPEFYVQPSGDMFFLYRNGSSGNGNIVLNRYSVSSGSWQRVQDNLISGEGRISPYWQACVDSMGKLHISWVWRETADASTNYNLSYAVSSDASGSTFVNSSGEVQTLPITEDRAKPIYHIPKGSALINQTAMTADGEDKPYIISYWRVNGVVQYNVIRFTGEQWIIYNTDIRNSNFDLSGAGTRQLPCARPQILVNGVGEDVDIYVLFRDDERGGKASIAKLSLQGMEIITEKMIDITGSSLEEWEPNYDIALWNQSKKINIFMQKEYFTADGKESKNQTEYIYVTDVTSFLNE